MPNDSWHLNLESMIPRSPKKCRILSIFHRVPLAASASLCNQNRHCHQCRHFQTDRQTDNPSKQKMGPELELLHSRNFILYPLCAFIWRNVLLISLMQFAVSHACPNFHLLEGPWPCRVGLLLKVFHLSDWRAGSDRARLGWTEI